VRHASCCLLRIYRALLQICRDLLRIHRAGLFCRYTELLREGYCEACQLLSFADIQGSFADIQGSFADVQGFFADKGSFANIPSCRYAGLVCRDFLWIYRIVNIQGSLVYI